MPYPRACITATSANRSHHQARQQVTLRHGQDDTRSREGVTVRRSAAARIARQKRLIDRFFVKGQKPDADFEWVEQPASEKSFLMGVHIDQIPRGRRAQHLGHIVVEDPEMTVVTGPARSAVRRTLAVELVIVCVMVMYPG